ncbi:MAG TPA: serine/threonine-protein kinase, partial [Longimicrobiales bacterium]|nr:serine/threonine-protein kinase [Longimicrobiales bacterium]
MALPSGTRVGPYEIVSALGAGGMGEVWRARDTRLDRDVALKVLPEAFVADPERLARFEREAKVLASLNHPHIGGIHGLEEADGTKALVLELVEGPTLADRIAQGPSPVDEALPSASQITEALEAAHELGIIHRDLKPANIKVRPDGTVKVLDFGLAKALEPPSAGADLSQSPTLSLSAAATRMGVILGTAAYMAPEQARGHPVDKRADIWAFGCVLYEMLAGKRAFAGSDVTDTLASVLRSEPDWKALPASTPAPIVVLLRRCLDKSPRNRLHDVADARIELADAIAGYPEAPRLAAGIGEPATTAVARTRGALVISGISALALVVGLVSGLALGRAGDRDSVVDSQPAPHPPTRTAVELPPSALLAIGTQYPLIGFEPSAVTLSPDGRHLVYVGQAEHGTQLYHHDLTRFEDPVAIAGTEGALYAFFSPSSSELGFVTENRIRKVPLSGGAATTLCRAATPILATWIDDTIYFSENQGRALASVPAAGGEPSRVFDTSTRLQRRGVVSSVLPGGRAALVSVESAGSSSSDYAAIWVVSLEGKDDKPLSTTGFDARWLPSGHLVFVRGERLLAAPFDLDRLELRSEPVPVLDGLALESIFGNVHAAFSENGIVAFVPGRDLAPGRLAWVDRQGNEGFLGVPERIYGVFDITADDRRFALQVADARDHVWIWDEERGGRVLASSASTGWPVWSPDGQALIYKSRSPDDAAVLLVRHELESGSVQPLLSFGDGDGSANSWVLPGSVGVTVLGKGVGVVSARTPGEPAWVEQIESGGSLEVWGAALAPGGEWMAYGSEKGPGRIEIWLEDVAGETRRQVSTDGGLEPVWCRECGEL